MYPGAGHTRGRGWVCWVCLYVYIGQAVHKGHAEWEGGGRGGKWPGVDTVRSYHRATQHWLQSSSKYGSSGRYEVVTSDWILGPANILAVTRHYVV